MIRAPATTPQRPLAFGNIEFSLLPALHLHPCQAKLPGIYNGISVLINRFKTLRQIGDNIVDVFCANRQPDRVGFDTGSQQFLLIHLRMGG